MRNWCLGILLLLHGLVLTSSYVYAEQNDIAIALRVAREYELTRWQTSALLCLRTVENGGIGREYGVLHPRALNTSQTNQAQWAAGSIRRRLPNAGGIADFAARWCPRDDPRDTQGLNQYWERNFRTCLAQLEDT
jgi:hypothetical protein